MGDDPRLEFIENRIREAKQSAESSKKAEDTCSQHGMFVDLQILGLDVAHMGLKENAEIKRILSNLVTPAEDKLTPHKTAKNVSLSVRNGLQLNGYGAWAAILIIGVLIVFVAVVGGSAIAEVAR